VIRQTNSQQTLTIIEQQNTINQQLITDINIADDETLDIICNEDLKLIQKRWGYRFSIDSIILSNFVVLKKKDRLLDIGSGCGIIPIYMSKKGYGNDMLGIEIQEELFGVSQKNILLNHAPNVKFIHGDIKYMEKELKKTPFHVVVANPPYTKRHTGRKSNQTSRVMARYESQLELSTLVSIASTLLFKKGRFYTIYPSKRLGELIYTSKAYRLEPKRIRFVHPSMERPANLFLAEFIKEGGIEIKVEKPLYIYGNDNYTDELQTYYSFKD